MPIIQGCCCFASLKSGSRASAVFTLVTAILNFAIDIWMLVNLHRLEQDLEENEKEIFIPPGIIVFIYIELAFNLAVLIFSAILWVGINFGYEGKSMVFAWVWGMFVTKVYQIFLMMYVLIWIGGHRISDIVYVVPESLVVAFYWMLNCIFLIVAELCVVSYWQELVEDIEGKDRRRRRFYKIANIRMANRPGTATPSYRGWQGSRQTLLSNPSLSHLKGPPSQSAYSTVSQEKPYQPPPQGQGYPPPQGQGYPPPQGQGYPPPQGQGYPPAKGQAFPPTRGQGYPPPQGQGYPQGQPHQMRPYYPSQSSQSSLPGKY